ncbi:right-handed parallel beta-helix repeat-containing protein [Clostridium arbusti]|uniref:right-handed parallel beta-helix repeat-containing protein n=1 Tax=Clostridium arbusti TaxID=1137848 RepID=UPI0002892335|nr:right-handed parallel beta-helix repeat-containing protein [Clostridium arbusti]
MAGSALRLLIDVYGAKGDGVTNDSTAIQNYFNSLNDGDFAFIPSGIYLYDSLNLNKSIIILGTGTLKLINNAAVGKININANNIQIYNLKLDGNKANNTLGTAFSIKNVSGITIENTHIHHFKYYGIYCENSSYNNFYNNIIEHIGDGLHDDGIRNNQFTTSAIGFFKVVNNCIVEKNIINNPSSFGIGFLLSSGSNNRIAKNTITNSSWIGIGQQFCTNHFLTDNTILNCYDNGIDLQKCPKSVVKNNILKDNGTAPAGSSGSGANFFWGSDTSDVVDGLIFQGNILTKSNGFTGKITNAQFFANNPNYMAKNITVKGNQFINGEVGFVNCQNTKCIDGNIFNNVLIFGTGIKSLDVNNNIFDNCPSLEIRDFINGFHISKNQFITCGSTVTPFAIYSRADGYHSKADIKITENKFVLSANRIGLLKMETGQGFSTVQFNNNSIDASTITIDTILLSTLIDIPQNYLECLGNKLKFSPDGGWNVNDSLMDLFFAKTNTNILSINPLQGFTKILVFNMSIGSGTGFTRVGVFDIIKRKHPWMSQLIMVNEVTDTSNEFTASTNNNTVTITATTAGNKGFYGIMISHTETV